MTTRLVAFAVLLVIVASVSGNTQTVALKDLPYFAGKYEARDTTRYPTLQMAASRLGTCLEWWRDSPNEIGLPNRLIKFDTGQPWPTDVRYVYNSLILKSWRQPVLTAADSFPTLKVLPQLFYDYYGGAYLTMWERIGQDSARYACNMPLHYGRWNFDSMWVDGSYIYPDLSVLIHLRYEGYDNGFRWGANIFVRYLQPDSLALILDSVWDAEKLSRHVFDLGLLSKGSFYTSYSSVFIREYLNKYLRRLPSAPMQVDSAHAEVIDLWQLAVQKFHIDTTAISRNH